MRLLSQKSFFLIVLGCLVFCGLTVPTAMAQDVATVQPDKTAGKMASIAAKIKENFQRVVTNISESQFGKTIGKGKENAKKALNFCKKLYKSAMAAYRKAVDKLKSGKAYKMIQLTKKLALEKNKLSDIQDQCEADLSTLKDAYEALVDAIKGKSAAEDENRAVAREIYQQQMEDAITDAEKEAIQKKIDALDSSSGSSGYASTLQAAATSLADGTVEAETNCAKRLAKQSKVIAEVGVEMANLYSKKTIPSPDEMIDSAKSQFSHSGKTLDEVEEEKAEGEKQAGNTTIDSINSGSSSMSPAAEKNEVNLNAQSDQTVTGESDAIQIAAESITNQFDAIKQSIILDAQALLVETQYIMLNEISDTEDVQTTIDICNYGKIASTSLKDLVNNAQSSVSSVKDTTSSLTNSLTDNEITQMVNDATQTVNDATGTVSNFGDMM